MDDIEMAVADALIKAQEKEIATFKLQNGVLLTYIERLRKNVSSDNICDCHGKVGEPHKADCLLIALYALEDCTCKFNGFHMEGCPGKKVESLGAGLADRSQDEANKLKVEIDKWVQRSRVAEDRLYESNRLNQRLTKCNCPSPCNAHGCLLKELERVRLNLSEATALLRESRGYAGVEWMIKTDNFLGKIEKRGAP